MDLPERPRVQRLQKGESMSSHLNSSTFCVTMLIALASSALATAADLAPMGAASFPPEFVPGEYVVGFAENGTSERAFARASSLNAAGFEVLDVIEEIGVYRVRAANLARPTATTRLNALDTVEFVAPNYVMHALKSPNDPLFPSQWALHRIGAPSAWDRTTGSELVVAIVDTGVELTHEDLRDRLWVNPREIPGNGVDDDRNGIVDDYHGARFLRGTMSGDPTDDHGHGTHVAGTVVASTDNRIGVAGVSWSARIMGVKFLDAGGSGTSFEGAKAIRYAVDNGAQFINCSWGSYGASLDVQRAISYAQARGRIVIAAAGNESNNNDSGRRMYPASFPNSNIISVLSTERNDTKSNFSNYGATMVDVGAPGRSILSTYTGNSYATLTGTSMAAPHVSGAAVLVKSLAGGWDNQRVLQYILDSALRVTGLAGTSVSGARLDINRATRSPASITSPSAGASWIPGSTERIEWDEAFRSSACPRATLDLSIDGGVTYSTSLGTGVALADRGIDVVVGNEATTDARIRVACEGTTLATVSESFRITRPLRILQPDATSTWRGGKRADVTWEGATDAGGNPACAAVDIDFSHDGGTTFPKRLATATANDGSERVRAPYRRTREAVVRVSCNATTDRAASDAFRTTNPLPVYIALIGLLAFGI